MASINLQPFFSCSWFNREYIPVSSVNFQDVLYGENPFYQHFNYLEATHADFSKEEALPTTYRWNTECKIIRVIKQILSIIIFPIAIYNLFHTLIGIFVLPACFCRILDCSKYNFNRDQWKYKRITVEVDGYLVDGVIFGKPSTLNNRRWTLFSNGNGESYEDQLRNNKVLSLLENTTSNGMFFNYSGVGASGGFPCREVMKKNYQACLKFLEDSENGIGAKEIVGHGYSLGGGVQGDVLQDHQFKENIKYVFVKSRTFSTLSAATGALLCKPAGFLLKVFGWNMNVAECSKNLKHPEIIMQTAKISENYEELIESSKIINDGVIKAKASLSKALLDDNQCSKINKIFIGIQERHNDNLKDSQFLAKKINELLSK